MDLNLKMSETASITLASDVGEMDRVAEFVQLLATRTECNADLEHRILLVLCEAVTNAIIHGNKKDLTKYVEITAMLDDSELILTVSDEGAGFDPDTIPNPLDEKNLLKTSGRGVLLIKEHSDDVTYSDDGSKVRILISLS